MVVASSSMPVKRRRGRPAKRGLPAKRGRPRKIVPELNPTPKTDGVKLPHSHPTTPDQIWDNAFTLAATISDHYAMQIAEQKRAFLYTSILEPGATIVELGVTHGRTAALLCYAAKLHQFTYWGVDDFSLEGNAETTKANLDKLGLPFHLLTGKTNEVPWSTPIDYLLIDAGHDVVNITQDCLRWLPFVNPGGLVLLHDYNPNVDQNDPHWGIKNAADKFMGYWETIDFMEWLLVKRKPLA